ncbi:hypothetical protein [Entomobacter blattae]|uniref:Uncharacterized protein n=1 Tax=Entomobacter blattae TaxID=2762277 RepID=A0A7H1NSD7_9PROT|nr:hypothetical protein [Entomobacter blattae]QNT78697.1 hypothetical protein JGUZn3_14740 [Entomobacter blattae]
MRSLALLGVCVILSGCSGFGKFVGDTATLPGDNPNMPSGNSENLLRAQGGAPTIIPILPQAGDVWPGEPKPLPTLSDVARSHDSGGALSFEEYLPKGTVIGGQTGKLLQEGGSLHIGESEAIKKGVIKDFSGQGLPQTLPSMPDKFKPQQLNAPIIVPNGDGTSTVITPGGEVKIIKDSALHSEENSYNKPSSSASEASPKAASSQPSDKNGKEIPHTP